MLLPLCRPVGGWACLTTNAVLRRQNFTYWDYAAFKCIETRANSRSVMLLICSGLHAHYTDAVSKLTVLRSWPEGVGESFEPAS